MTINRTWWRIFHLYGDWSSFFLFLEGRRFDNKKYHGEICSRGWNNTKGDGERKEWEWRRKEWWSATNGKPPTFRGMCNFVDVPWFYRICRALPANPDLFVNFWYEPRGSKVKEQPVSNANFLWNYSNTFLRSTIRWPYRFHSSSFSIPIISFRLKCPPLLERPLWSMRYLDLTGTKNLRKILEAKVWYANLSLSLSLECQYNDVIVCSN